MIIRNNRLVLPFFDVFLKLTETAFDFPMPALSSTSSVSAPSRSAPAERLRRTRRLVEEELRVLAVGDRLPPVRQLRERCGVGLSQLQQVMAGLERDGLIERRPRSGLYKAGTPPLADVPQAVVAIDLVACGRLSDIRQQHSGTFMGHLIEALAAEAGERGWAIRLRQVFAHESVARYEAIAADPSIRGCLLLGPHLPELSALFERQGVRTIAMVPKQPQPEGVAILDSSAMVQLQFDHLWELGHRRIAYMDHVLPDLPDMVFLQRRETFYRLMAERGAPVDPRWVFHVPFEEVEGPGGFEILEKVFGGRERPTAVIVGDLFAPTVYRFAQARGWRIGRELSVVGTDDMPVASVLEPRLTAVHNDRVEMARMAIATLEKRLRGEVVPAMQQLPLRLVVRASTGPVEEGV